MFVVNIMANMIPICRNSMTSYCQIGLKSGRKTRFKTKYNIAIN